MKIKILLLGFMLICSFQGFGQFITEWNTGGSGSITIPTFGTGYNYTATIALRDTPGTIIATLTGLAGNASFTGLMQNTAYQVKITGTFPRIYFNNSGDRLKLKTISQWGNIVWKSFSSAFFGCGELTVTATDVPVLSNVTNLGQMFRFCPNLNGPSNIGNWNTATVTDMSYMFSGDTAFNQDIGSWNTGSVTSMAGMYAQATAFNQDIGNWNTGAVTDMYYMFGGATAFNQYIGNWNTGAVKNMNGMFQGAIAFDQNIGAWNTAAVTDMYSMFNAAAAFNQNIGSWNTGLVTTMGNMFGGATAFNQNIGSWNVSAVTDMSSMFFNAIHFNQDIGAWNTASLANMNAMFKQAASFNQDIGSWNTASVWNMLSVFQEATAFNQDISNWDIAAAISMEAMFRQASAFNQNLASWGAKLNLNAILNSSHGGFLDNCDMSAANYDAILVGFSASAPNGRAMGASGLYYCNDGATARANMVLPLANGGKGWTISGDTSLVASTPLLAAPGTIAVLTYAGCNYDWSKPANRARKMLVINPNDTIFSPSGVVINHNTIGVLPAGITSSDGYYQTSNNAGSTRISNRLVSISDTGTYSANGGVIVRIYYSAAEYTNIVVNSPPIGEIVDAGWFKSNTTDAAGVVAAMSGGNNALPGAEKILPYGSGSENGIAYVDFKITGPGTIGLYAKTLEGPLSVDVPSTRGKNFKAVLYPNPAGNILNLKLPDDRQLEVLEISITNMLGQTTYRNTGHHTSIDVAFLSAGLYQVAIKTDKGNWNGKFMKE